jgi:hypothetical protein
VQTSLRESVRKQQLANLAFIAEGAAPRGELPNGPPSLLKSLLFVVSKLSSLSLLFCHPKAETAHLIIIDKLNSSLFERCLEPH